MPFFHHKSDEEKEQERLQKGRQEQLEREREASLQSLAAGGLPVQAQRRLQELQQKPGFFTSDLSVNEFLLSTAAGFEPITQVMGSSIYHVGFQNTNSMWNFMGSMELTTVSTAWNHARSLALGRLMQEAQLAGANAVVGVHVKRGRYDWNSDHIEFTAIGTAVRIKGQQAGGTPVLTNLSGTEFWKLVQSGFYPAGIVAATSVFYVRGWGNQMANSWFGGWANQELGDFTAGVYQSRGLAMQHVHQQAAGSGALGVMGMVIDREEREIEVEQNNSTRTDIIFSWHVLGTAIVEIPDRVAPPTYPVVSLSTSTPRSIR